MAKEKEQEWQEAELWTVIRRAEEGDTAVLRIGELGIPVLVEAELLADKPGVSPEDRQEALFKVLSALGLAVARVEFYHFDGLVFNARLVVTGREFTGERPLEVDVRQGTALEVLVAGRCPLYVSREVVDKIGVPMEVFFEMIEAKKVLEQGE